MTRTIKCTSRLLILCLLTLSACTRSKSEYPTPLQPTPTKAATFTPVQPQTVPTETPSAPQATSVAVQGLKLEPQTTQKSDDKDRYTLQVTVPVLAGVSGASAEGFNQAIDLFVTDVLTGFQNMAQQAVDDPAMAAYSSTLQVGYNVQGVVNGVLSVQFSVESYVVGAAHPAHYSHSINYVLSTGKLLALSDLFSPGADYLKTLADYCLQDLKTRQVLDFEEGTQPKVENYQNWNLQIAGLLITFDEYQVAPYAAGAQTVLIPYSILHDILNPAGPLAPFAK